MANKNSKTETAANAANENTNTAVELTAKDVAIKSAIAKVEKEFDDKRKAELAAKAAMKAAKVIPEGTTGKALTNKARRAKFELPAGYNTLLEYITAWATTQSANGNEAALLRVAKSLNRVTNPSERTKLRRECKQIIREIGKLNRGIELLGEKNISKEILERRDLLQQDYDTRNKRRTELAEEAAAKAATRKAAKAAKATK